MNDHHPPTQPTTVQVALRSGTLTLTVEHAELGLGDLCGYACRRSRKRGFVFVSKVLGKHYPVRPRLMEEIHARLAAKLAAVAGPAVVIGLAETAIGLAQGIYEQMLRLRGRTDTLFIHTTRYQLSQTAALRFHESHSHASEHLLFAPVDPEASALFREADSVILIDDEISTGNTLANLATAYHRYNPALKAVHIVSITDWLGAECQAEIACLIGLSTRFHSLLRGRFTFVERADFDPGPIPNSVGRGELKDAYLARNFGRLGVRGPLDIDLAETAETLHLRPGERVLVLGTGEFLHAPFLLAHFLERQGWDVHFQSTTRSPLLTGDNLASVIETVDNYHDAIPNYLFNVADRSYDRTVACYETNPLPAAHVLPESLRAATVFL